ncbi:MAG: hypothetical protein E6Q95_01685 [Chitinophagaceae bacterium]|nr:MAG: hypothetical protein E6Q95_01685 [Chitinophagaceae bacterium]
MNKIEALIEKLSQQYKSKSDFSQMLSTVMMLQQEINGAMRTSNHLGSENVSVFMPKTIVNAAPLLYEIESEKETYNLNIDEKTFHTLNMDELDEDDFPDESMPDLETVQLYVKEEQENIKATKKNSIDISIFLPLFRDNHLLMERSIKTAEKFSNADEALEWMDNELAKKLSWNLEEPLVLRFYKMIIEKLY